MKGKIILCRCEDVTLADVEHSIERGYADIEEVKRYTGFGTGPCQGKECLAVIATVIAERTSADPATVPAFTSRPPLAPTPLKFYAGVREPDTPPSREVAPGSDARGGSPDTPPSREVAPGSDARGGSAD